ncbi:helix-turn-helix domain-containing protein [Rhizobium sp. FKL33]|uniref:helix-turn-helix domain-containing protein n=1 Tax=Rhizobium sp. FKL33 TaxID=2562307 RepID=UPI0010BF961F|nr:helix-turn-helix domain-containing protein [Rhizobium sp. FKL33]
MPLASEDDESIADLIRRECGHEIAEKFLKAFAGVRCNIPSDPSRLTKHSRLVKLLGSETAWEVAKATGYVSETIPLGDAKGSRVKKRRAEALTRQGLSVRDIALELDLHERTIFRWRSEWAKAPKKQATPIGLPAHPLQKKA